MVDYVSVAEATLHVRMYPLPARPVTSGRCYTMRGRIMVGGTCSWHNMSTALSLL
ncbi:hypothetical protein VFPBJ_04867 [Purpureocillium lilacinum]|uniref:Uncharacterized protein n=1 Tax=Purpureocillium lilacinum TaxID=33203 RepID=A0A179GYB6_PURLI|nr:hypothetical protein VFPBJ_04867 [Purpureocillium lilacinum]